MTNWDELLGRAQFAVNSAWQDSVQNTSFYLNHGRHPKTPLGASLGRTHPSQSRRPASAACKLHMQTPLTPATACMLAAQQRQ